MAHTREWKEKNRQILSQAIRNSRVIGVSSIRGLPASQFQQIRKKLNGVAEIHVSRSSLLKMAIKDVAAERNGIGVLEADVSKDQEAIIS